MYIVKIPLIGNVSAETIEALGDAAWTAVHGGNKRGEFYGASQVGGNWTVWHNGEPVGSLRYNGRFDTVSA